MMMQERISGTVQGGDRSCRTPQLPLRSISPDEIPVLIPGKALLPEQGGRWKGLQVQRYEFEPVETIIPALRDLLIILYRRPGYIYSKVDGVSRRHYLEAGDCSLLMLDSPSEWRWQNSLENTLVYLSRETVANVASEIFDQKVENVHLTNVIKLRDHKLREMVSRLADEAGRGTLGGELYAQAISTQIAVTLLRRYCDLSCGPTVSKGGGLSITLARRVKDYIEENLAKPIQLDDMASVACISPFHFLRQFKAHFGCPPHTYVIRQRLNRAYALLVHSDRPLKQIAASCGFCDQSHMSRAFRAGYGRTPGEVRAGHSNSNAVRS